VFSACRASALALAVVLALGCSADGASSPRSSSSRATAPATAPATTVTDPPPSSSTAPPTTAAVTTTVVTVPTRVDGEPDAAAVAVALTEVERRLLDTTDDMNDVERGELGVRQQLWYRYLAAWPELDEAVLAALDSDVRSQVERIVRARQLGQARAAASPTPLPDTIPAWRIVEPLPVATLRGFYDEAAAATGVDWWWLAAIHLQETRFGRIDGVSSAGAVGPMQFLPSTWADCCVGSPLDAREAIIGAATYLAQSGAPGDMAAAVYRYNPNPSYVAIVTAYAENLRDHPSLLHGYHAWQVFVGTTAGTVRLPVGFAAETPIDAVGYLTEHPDDLATVRP
jgi:membrane-bound lytic murein transglycosylase B